jgi:alpha-L-fucosidase 2
MKWSGGRVTSVEVLSKEGQTCRIKAGTKVTVRSAGASITTRQLPDGSVEFPTEKGIRYQISSL